MYLINWAAKCQSKNLCEQYHSGVRYFDIRVRFDKKGKPVIAHGLVEYKGIAENYICILNEIAKHYKDKVYVRFVLEFNREPKDRISQEVLLSKFVQNLMKEYSYLIYDYIMCKWNEKVIVRYSIKIIYLFHRYSSTLGWKRFLWIPYWYAKLHNKNLMRTWDIELKDKDNRVLMLDLV
nr:MAG TPA: hypothetical protein [Crassvirales sp.]